jgi:hypothetical protein
MFGIVKILIPWAAAASLGVEGAMRNRARSFDNSDENHNSKLGSSSGNSPSQRLQAASMLQPA